MSEKLLDVPQARPHVEEVRRVTVPQAVGVDSVRNTSPQRPLGQDPTLAPIIGTQVNEPAP